MRDLIRKTLREYHHPVLVYEIKLSQNLQEADTFIRFIKKETPEIVLMKNDHSQDSIGDSGFSRVDPDYINDSIQEIEPDIVSSAKKIVDTCFGNPWFFLFFGYSFPAFGDTRLFLLGECWLKRLFLAFSIYKLPSFSSIYKVVLCCL